MRLLLLALVSVPVVGFSLACAWPGCGKGPGAPDEVSVESYAQHVSDTGGLVETGQAEDTGIVTPGACGDAEPAVRFDDLGEEVRFRYEEGCGGEDEVVISVIAHGIAPGYAAAAWKVTVEGEPAVEQESSWNLRCGSDGTLRAMLLLAMPERHDGKAVTVELILVDAEGTEVSTSGTFIASVTVD